MQRSGKKFRFSGRRKKNDKTAKLTRSIMFTELIRFIHFPARISLRSALEHNLNINHSRRSSTWAFSTFSLNDFLLNTFARSDLEFLNKSSLERWALELDRSTLFRRGAGKVTWAKRLQSSKVLSSELSWFPRLPPLLVGKDHIKLLLEL